MYNCIDKQRPLQSRALLMAFNIQYLRVVVAARETFMSDNVISSV